MIILLLLGCGVNVLCGGFSLFESIMQRSIVPGNVAAIVHLWKGLRGFPEGLDVSHSNILVYTR